MPPDIGTRANEREMLQILFAAQARMTALPRRVRAVVLAHEQRSRGRFAAVHKLEHGGE
jgi:hypothetical protein